MIIEALTAVANAVAKIFGYADNRQALKNAADVKAGAVAAAEQKQTDAITQSVASGDLASIRDEAAE